jgi:hypothetical protein
MDQPNVVVLTPCYGGMVSALYASSMMKLYAACAARAIPLRWNMGGGDAMITRARAEMVHAFLQMPDATHFLFIDADIGFEPEQALRLIEFGADFVAAAYPIKNLDWRKVGRAFARTHPRPEAASLTYVIAWEDSKRIEARAGFARVRFAGTGFLLVARHVIVKLCAAHPELKYRATHRFGAVQGKEEPDRYALFDPLIDPVSGEYLSEDFAFCKRWTEIGGEIWMDIHSRLDHVGAFVFRGDLSTQVSNLDPAP